VGVWIINGGAGLVRDPNWKQMAFEMIGDLFRTFSLKEEHGDGSEILAFHFKASQASCLMPGRNYIQQ